MSHGRHIAIKCEEQHTPECIVRIVDPLVETSTSFLWPKANALGCNPLPYGQVFLKLKAKGENPKRKSPHQGNGDCNPLPCGIGLVQGQRLRE